MIVTLVIMAAADSSLGAPCCQRIISSAFHATVLESLHVLTSRGRAIVISPIKLFSTVEIGLAF